VVREERLARGQRIRDVYDPIRPNDDSSQDSIANVDVLLTFGDGSTSLRNTYFVCEDGSWKHRFGSEEYELFATAQTATASASADGSSSASASPAGTKHIKVVISSNVPVDVYISDDNLDWLQQEEITGTKTYERDIAKGSGLTVSATSANLRGDVSIEVYDYALVLLVRIAAEVTFSRLFFPNIVAVVGLAYTPYRLRQLCRARRILEISDASAKVGGRFARTGVGRARAVGNQPRLPPRRRAAKSGWSGEGCQLDGFGREGTLPSAQPGLPTGAGVWGRGRTAC
jgi:hypothetical protein